MYRNRIGTFRQKRIKIKFGRFILENSCSKDSHCGFMLKWLKIFLLITVAFRISQQYPQNQENCQNKLNLSQGFVSSSWENSYPRFEVGLVGNFFARYLHGNGPTGPKGVKVYHLNIRSLQNKVSEVKKITKEIKPHVLGISECELKNTYQSEQVDKLKIPGYSLLLPKSWNLHGYARIVVYVKNTFDYQRIEELEDEHLQTIWIKCGFKNSKHGLYSHGYREHKSNLGASITNQKEKLSLFIDQWERALNLGNPSEPNDVFVLCDMNLDSYKDKWLNPNYHLYSLTQLVQRSCNSNNITQLVKDITRAQYNSVSNKTDLSCIDHIYTNVKYKCSKPVICSFGDSDHDLIGFTRLSKKPPEVPRTIRKRSYKLFNKEKFLYDLRNEDFTDVLSCPDLDMAVTIFTNKFKNILNVHAPWIIFQQRKKYSPWITAQTMKIMTDRDHWKNRAKNLAANNSNSVSTPEEVEAWQKYKELRNKVNNTKRNEEYKFKRSKIEENIEDPNSMWGTVKGFMDWKRSGTPSQIVVNNVLYKKAKDVAKLMNEFFISKVENLRRGFGGQNLNLTHCRQAMKNKKCSLGLEFVSVKQVKKLLKNLKSSKAVAIDELDSYSLKISADIIAAPVHHLVTLSIMQRRFPTAWKYSKVLPLHKKNCVLDRKNYRPVSILSPLSKILERAIYNQIYQYFSKRQIFHPNLMGYRKNRSTLTAVLQMFDRWVRGASEGKVSGVVLLDLSAAFDLVNPQILLRKLEVYGLDAGFLEWVKSYLSERKQAVWIDHILSDWLDVNVGVPQGSILGPLLFIIFANDLPHSLTCHLDQYADDSTLSCTKATVAEINLELSENCDQVSTWMTQNELCLNADKTHLMVGGTSQRLLLVNPAENIDIKMENIQLTESDEKYEKLLGVLLQPNLKWSKHIQDLQQRLKDRLSGLVKIRFIVGLKIRKTVAEGIFHSVLTYCIAAWGGAEKGHLQDLQVMQNKAAQLVLNYPSRSHRETMYNNLGWLTVNQLVVFHSVLAVYQIRKYPQ